MSDDNTKVIHHDFRKETRRSEKMRRLFFFSTISKQGKLDRYLETEPSNECFAEEEIKLFHRQYIDKSIQRDDFFKKIDEHLWSCDRCTAFYTKINNEYK